MKPVTVSVDVPQSREVVYDFLDVMANHEPFNDHLMKDWELSGPASGVGSKARVRKGRSATVRWTADQVRALLEAAQGVRVGVRSVGRGRVGGSGSGQRERTGTHGESPW